MPNNLIIDKFHKNIIWALYLDLRTSEKEYYKNILENAIKDFSPASKDNGIKLLDSSEGIRSAEKLKEILGKEGR
jgi:hypothetical protein